jgi:hypothetical protein
MQNSTVTIWVLTERADVGLLTVGVHICEASVKASAQARVVSSVISHQSSTSTTEHKEGNETEQNMIETMGRDRCRPHYDKTNKNKSEWNEQHKRNKHQKRSKQHERVNHPNIITYNSPRSIIIQLEQRDGQQLHVLGHREDLLPWELDEEELLTLLGLRDVCGNEWVLLIGRIRQLGMSLDGMKSRGST